MKKFFSNPNSIKFLLLFFVAGIVFFGSATSAQAGIKFLDPGGDATFVNANTNGTGFLIGGGSGVTIASDIVHGSHSRSLQFEAGTVVTRTGSTPSGSLADSGSRINLYDYFVALPDATASIWYLYNGSVGNRVSLRMTSAGTLQLWKAETSQIGTDGPTLATGQWYRIAIAFTITNSTTNRFELFVYNEAGNSVGGISITNATLAGTGVNLFRIGNINKNATLEQRVSDVYIETDSSLTDPGNILVTAKRPVANGTANEFTTQVGSGGSGYGSGHTPQVNERNLSVSNAWSINTTTKKTEEYTIEAANVGDIDISADTILGYMGWINAKVNSTADSPVHNIIVAGTPTTIGLTTASKMFFKPVDSSTYPAGNTDIGIDAQYTTNPHLTTLNEAGIVVAYIPLTTPADSYWVGGTGNWSDAANHWATTTNGTPGSGYLPDTATNVHFDSNSVSGTATINSASVTVANFDQSASGITVATSTNGITITGDMTVAGTVSGATAVTLNSASKTITGSSGATISSPVVLGATRTVAVASGTFTMSGIISGSTFGLSKTGTGQLTLSGANTFTGGVTIRAGTVNALNNNSFGDNTSVITIGDTSGTATATLNGDYSHTFANPITVASGSSGTLSITNIDATTFTGAITLNNNLTLNSGWNALSLSGGITGTGNIVFTGAGNATLSTNPINMIGTITNSSSSSNSINISSIIGTNVTGVIQNSATSQLTLSGVNTFTSGLTIKAGIVQGQTSNNAFGGNTNVITIGDTSGTANARLDGYAGNTFANPITVASGSSGTLSITNTDTTAFSGNITLNNNVTFTTNWNPFTISGNITGTGNIIINASGGTPTFSGSSINNIGTITNSGDDSGTATISAAIGTNVTGITQNSATSALTLSGTNTYTGPVTNSAGTLNLAQTNTFSTITLGASTTTTITAAKVITVGTNLVSNGGSGTEAILNSSSAGSAASLSKASGTITVTYLSIKDSTATGGANWNAFTSSGNINVSGNTGWNFAAATTTLGDGTDGSSSTIGPGASATEIGRFSLVTNSGTDTVTGMTVTLAGDASVYTNIATVGVYTTADALKCSSSSWGSDNLVELTSCAIAVTTSGTEYVIKITPKTHANMAAVPGASYATTATVTAITATNGTAGTDTDSATITVDNASPALATGSTLANDDFTQGSDITLASHTPTGTSAGTGWVVQITSGSITDKAGDYITEASGANGNRYKMNNSLGSDEMDVSADFTSSASAGGAVFFGLLGRLPSSTGSTAYEANYDHSIASGSWVLSDGTDSATAAEAWPGGVVNMKFEMRSGVARLYANGVLKVTLSSNRFTGQNYAGIFLGNFSGVAGKVTADNFKANSVPTASAGAALTNLSWTNPADSDFTTSGTVVVLRRTTSVVTDIPVEGTTYSVGNTIGSSTVACVVTGSPPATTCQDTGLSNGTPYYYKIFTEDSRENYDAGTVPSGSPVTPVATTLGDGTDGSSSTIGPGASAAEIGRFSLVTSSGTDTVTGMTVTLAGDTSVYTNIATVGVYTTADALKCSSSSWGSDNLVELTSCAIAVTTSGTEYVIKITPKTHANMPAVPGASYATTATVTAITATNSTAGTDTDSATITVDNASPAGVTSSTASGGDTIVDLAWTNPADSDFTTSGTVVVLRRTTSVVTDVPVEGTTYTVGNTIGSSTVACVVTGSPPATTCQDTGLSNGTPYYYKIFTEDSRGNYDAGTVPTGSPVTPVATLTDAYWVGGTGNWSDAATHWAATSGGAAGAENLPVTTTNVHFDSNSGSGTATINSASVTVANFDQSASGITVATSTNGITITGDMTVAGTISGVTAVTLNSSSKSITGSSGASVSSPVILGATRTVAVASGTFTMSGIISGSTFGLSKTGTGQLTLSGANTFTGGLTIKAGTVAGQTSANAFGDNTNTVTLGDTSGTADATLVFYNSLTVANPITVATGSSGTLSIGSNTGDPTFSGAITLNNNLTINSNSNTSITGGVTGTGNLILNNPTAYALSISSGSINNIGTVTHSGAGAGATSISSIIGTNVTGVIQNSTTSQFNLSGVNTFTGGLTIKAGTVYGTTSANAFGGNTNVVTIGDTSGSADATMKVINGLTFANPITVSSGSSGTLSIVNNGSNSPNFSGAVTLSNNLTITALSTGANLTLSGGITGTGNIITNVTSSGGITLATATINNIGTITNSGAGGGTTTISAAIGTNVTSVIQNSSTSQLTLSGASTLGGSVAVTSGTLSQTGAITVGTTLTISDGGTFTQGAALTVNGNTTIGGGTSGIFTAHTAGQNLLGNLTLNVGATWTKAGSGTLVFKHGSGGQTITDSTASPQDLGNVQVSVNGTNTTLTLASNAKFTTLAVDSNQIFSQGASYNITTGAVTISASGTWSNIGTGDITLSGGVSNSGIVTIKSNNDTTCSGTDDIVIATSDGATQRTWTNTGTMDIYNVSASYQTGSITVYNSTNTSNNGWTFSNSGCTVTISGNVYGDETGSPAVWSGCSATTNIALSVNGGTKSNVACDAGTGAFSFSNQTVAANNIIALFLDTAGGDKGVLYTRAVDDATSITGLSLTKNVIKLRYEAGTSITNADINTYDLSNDADIPVASDGTAIGSDVELHIDPSMTFTPGGGVTIDNLHVKGTYTGGGETLTTTNSIVIDSGGTFNSPTNVTLGGNLTNNGTYSSANSTGYSYSRSITIDHTLVGSADSTNFPVLVSGTYDGTGGIADLRTTGNGGKVQNSSGYDVIFTSDSTCTTKLNWETETYTAASGLVNYWVQVPSLSYTADTVFYMCYGNSGITTDQSNTTGTWDSAYVSVYHLPNGTTLDPNDSTSNGNNGTNTSVTATTGKIDGGGAFGGSAKIEADGTAAGVQTGSFTYSAWVTLTNSFASGQAAQIIMRNGDSPSNNDIMLSFGQWGFTNVGSMMFQYTNASSALANGANTNTTSWSAGTPYYVTLTYNATGGYNMIYINGSQNSSTFSGATRGTTPYSTHFAIGASYNTPNNYFNGTIDEVRVSNSVRTPDWITAEYNNQNSPSTFYTVGSETDPAENTTMTVAPTGSSSTIDGTNGITFNNFTVAGASGANKSLKFKSDNNYIFNGAFDIAGQSGSNLSLASTTPGSQWFTTFISSAVAAYASILDSGCLNGIDIASTDTLTNLGNNGVCWKFVTRSGGSGGVEASATPDPQVGDGSGDIGGGSGDVEGGGDPVTATGTAVMSSGSVASVTIDNGGSGYGTTAPTVAFCDGGGSGAVGTAVLSAGAVASVTIDNGGANYSSPPSVLFGGTCSAGGAGGGGGGDSGFLYDNSPSNNLASAIMSGVSISEPLKYLVSFLLWW